MKRPWAGLRPHLPLATRQVIAETMALKRHLGQHESQRRGLPTVLDLCEKYHCSRGVIMRIASGKPYKHQHPRDAAAARATQTPNNHEARS